MEYGLKVCMRKYVNCFDLLPVLRVSGRPAYKGNVLRSDHVEHPSVGNKMLASVLT